MKVGYLDTSCLVAIAFDEPGGVEPGGVGLVRRLEEYDELVSSNLLEAEFRAVLQREQVDEGADMLARVAWVLPDRPLTPEIGRVLNSRDLRGAALWHLATALFVADDPAGLDFLTLDVDQGEAALGLGFPAPATG